MPDLAARLTSALAGRYTIERLLGRGGMATVFLAHDLKHDRDVAIKVLAPELSAAIPAERFHREIHIQARLRHPHLVTLLDSGDADGLLYYVMTYIEGESLRQRLIQGQLELGEMVRLWRDVVDGIAYAHRHGVAHRDIKPENVLLAERHALVADFGVAKALGSPAVATQQHGTAALTGVGIAIGTPAYMSPEQVSGGSDPNAGGAGGTDVDHRSDIYALGILAYEMLAGRPPFTGSTVQSVFAAQVSDTALPIQQLRQDVSPTLAAAIHRCIEKDPARRWQSADELLATLDSLATPSSSKGLVARLTRTPGGRRWLGAAIAAAVVVLTGAGYAVTTRQSRVRWAREVGLPELRRLTDARISDSALLLGARIREALPRDAEVNALWARDAWRISLATTPSNARVSWAAYRGDTATWIPLGNTPLDSAPVPAQPFTSPVFVLLKVEAPGRATTLLPMTDARTLREPVQLENAATADSTMSRVPPTTVALPASDGGVNTVRMGAYDIARLEVTNAEYKRFVDAGGYRRAEYWQEPFISQGHTLSLQEAMRRFTDRTGRPGPSTWEGGAPPREQERYPVTGVSWYEAAAYARFAGKQLPTIHQWRNAAGFAGNAWIVPKSNMESSALKPVGTGGMGPYGTFDMAGNAREWCVNAVGTQRHILGGAWSDPPWIFADRFSADPFDRSTMNGLRLVKSLDDTNAALLRAPSPRGERDYMKERPVSDAEFRTFAPLYDYDRTPLNVRVESVDSSNADWIRQTVTFDAAYGGERVIAHVVLPRHGRPPYQAVVLGAGGNAFGPGSSETMTQTLPFVVASGRAVLYPVLRNMYERTDDRVNFGNGAIHNMSGELLGPNTYREQLIMMMKDVRRSVDYLASRSDVDTTRIAYLGTSWGARVGPIVLAIEPRFKLGLLDRPGLMTAPRRPEADEFNFLPRVKVPTLQLSGKYDDIFPLDKTAIPFFRLLGTPPEHKRQVVYPTQHFVPRDQQIAETLNWLDRYFGRPQSP